MNLYYDLESGRLCSELGVSLRVEPPVLHFMEKPVWHLHVYESGETRTPCTFFGAQSFRAAVASDLNGYSDPICRTLDASIDKTDLQAGILAIPLNAATSGFQAACIGSDSKKAYFELWGFAQSTDPVFYLRFEIRISDVLDSAGGADIETITPDAISRAEVMACIRAADERQYTADPSDPSAAHSIQTDSDTHTRRRNSAAAGEWGPWEALVPGPQGNTPILSGGSTTTLSPGASATAELVSSGGSTYILNLGLPKGETGALTPLQEYSSDSGYEALTCVTYNGGGYQVVSSTTAGENPDNAPSKFLCFARRGDVPDFQPIISGGSTISPQVNHIYQIPLSSGMVISVNSSGLSSAVCITQELWLDMPSSVVSFTLPGFTWINGAVPDFSIGNTRYVLTVRWNGSRFLANSAYEESLV